MIKLLIGIFLTLSVSLTFFFIGSSLYSNSLKGKNFYIPSLATLSVFKKIYYGLALIGWCSIVFLGVKSQLFWLPDSKENFIHIIAIFSTLASLILFENLMNLPFISRELYVSDRSHFWLFNQMLKPYALSDFDLECLKNEAANENQKPLEKVIANINYERALLLKKRDELLIENYKNQEKYLSEQQETKRIEGEILREKIEKDRKNEYIENLCIERLNKMLDVRLKKIPVLFDKADFNIRDDFVLDNLFVSIKLEDLEKTVVSLIPNDKEQAINSKNTFSECITKLEGVICPFNLELEMDVRGHDRDGYCDVFGIVNGTRIPIAEYLKYDMTISGLLMAFFFGALFKPYCSWGHGFYDRDYSLILSKDALLRALINTNERLLNNPIDGEWPPVGLRMQRVKDGFIVSGLFYRNGMGLFELSVRVSNGRAEPLQIREVYKWGNGVFY